MRRGEIWAVDLPSSSGREQSGRRPALIIQDEIFGQQSPLILAVPMTSQLTALRFPATVRVDPTQDNGLSLFSVALVFQSRAIDRTRFAQRLGRVDQIVLNQVLDALNKLTGQ